MNRYLVPPFKQTKGILTCNYNYFLLFLNSTEGKKHLYSGCFALFTVCLVLVLVLVELISKTN